MQGQVHLCQGYGALFVLHAVHSQFAAGGLAVPFDELGALNEHAARTASRVENPPVKRLDQIDDQADDRVGRKELAAQSALTGSEVGQEVLINQPKCIT